VLPAIEGRDEFFVADREWGKVINYTVNFTDTFPPIKVSGGSAKMREEKELTNALRRECRGILFYPDGRIMSRRLQKFFNLNERDETQIDKIDFSQPHIILEKLDGSMITPVITNDGIRYGTKMGITDVSIGAEEYVKANSNISEFVQYVTMLKLTPIFEWCSRKQRIVIDYPQDRLVLIAVRDNVTGEYMSYDQLLQYGNQFGIDVVKAYNGTAANMEMLLNETRQLKGVEGYVLRFNDGHMLKIKADEYVQFHKTKDNMNFEKNIVNLLVNEKMDDAKSFMMEEDRVRVEKFENNFWNGVTETVTQYTKLWNEICANKLDRKRFAIERMPALKNKDQFVSGIIFGAFDGKDIRSIIIDVIRNNCSTQTKVDQTRQLWGGHKWQYHYEGDI
jgi:RNA ligase